MAKPQETGHTEFMTWASSTPAESTGTQEGKELAQGMPLKEAGENKETGAQP